ncbi:MAG: hypothetical protein M1820_010178 [Bogoriella megaspora]|nr:MAG: hypothetical protein M1820_010178 [Bogoriella megaspora]
MDLNACDRAAKRPKLNILDTQVTVEIIEKDIPLYNVHRGLLVDSSDDFRNVLSNARIFKSMTDAVQKAMSTPRTRLLVQRVLVMCKGNVEEAIIQLNDQDKLHESQIYDGPRIHLSGEEVIDAEIRDDLIQLGHEADVRGFPVYMTWLYNNDLFDSMNHEIFVEPMQDLCHAFVFAIKHGILSFKISAYDALLRYLKESRDKSSEPASIETLCFVYANTSRNCPLRKLVNRWHALCIYDEGRYLSLDDTQRLPRAFLGDLTNSIVALSKRRATLAKKDDAWKYLTWDNVLDD